MVRYPFRSTLVGLISLSTFIPYTGAVGTAYLINQCGIPVYFTSVGPNSSTNMHQLVGSYSQAYGAENVGISIKLSLDDTVSGPISQFEFTRLSGKVNYDLSNINGHPFSSDGITLVPSMQHDLNNPTCVPIQCPAGQSVCQAAYNAPDDIRTLVCDQNSDLTLTICPGGNQRRLISKGHNHPARHVHRRV